MPYQPLYATLTDNQGTAVHTASRRGIVENVDVWISAEGRGSATIRAANAGEGPPRVTVQIPDDWTLEITRTAAATERT